MKNLKNRVVDDDGNVVYYTDGLLELMYNNIFPNEILFVDSYTDVKRYNKYCYENYENSEIKLPKSLESLEKRKDKWFYPEDYNNIDLEEYFINLCTTNEEIIRAKIELELFKNRNMDNFLRFCIYFSDMIKQNDWAIGVGRGSSVNSLLLYLCGINLINPLEYGLDIHEFLK